MTIAYAPKGKTGGANATFFAGFDEGIGLGSIISGIVASNTSYSTMYLLQIIPLVFAIIIYRYMKKKRIWKD